MVDILCYFIGILLVVIAALDVFLTVLYSRSGISLLSSRINKSAWLIFRSAALKFPSRKDMILSFCGPFLMVFNLAIWATLLIVGFALIAWPQMGEALTASQGATGRGFWSAFFYSGYTFTTLGLGDVQPRTDLFRLLSIIESAMGFSFFTMTITYFLSVYNGIQKRNTLAMILHHKTRGTGDAAEYLAGIRRARQVQEVSRELSQDAAALSELHESHHLYPILHYFRFKESRYALPRILAISMETASIARSLGEGPCREFKDSAAPGQLWVSTLELLRTLTHSFLPERFHDPIGSVDHVDHVDHVDTESWRDRFVHSMAKIDGSLSDADLASATGIYIQSRKQWNYLIVGFCQYQAFTLEEIMPYDATLSR
jgi:hypothetical protein